LKNCRALIVAAPIAFASLAILLTAAPHSELSAEDPVTPRLDRRHKMQTKV
jgi:hypothetical protein